MNTTASNPPRTVAFLLLPQFSLMAFASASEPLRSANRLSGRVLYRWFLMSERGDPITSSNGMESIVHYNLDTAPAADMIIVMASYEPERATTPGVLRWLRRRANQPVLLGGVDTGAYVLARAGLLNGYRTAVHWEYLDAFQQQFPLVRAEQAIFLLDRQRLSAAGGASCLDLMLHLIGLQHGQPLAAAVADQFVYGRMRSGEDHQRLALVQRLPVRDRHIIQAVSLMEQHVEDTLATAQIAAAVGLSVRQLERLFRRGLQTSPGVYYRSLRLERARALLLQSPLSISEIAAQCGFGSVASFSRAYKERYGCTPSGGRRETSGERTTVNPDTKTKI